MFNKFIFRWTTIIIYLIISLMIYFSLRQKSTLVENRDLILSHINKLISMNNMEAIDSTNKESVSRSFYTNLLKLIEENSPKLDKAVNEYPDGTAKDHYNDENFVGDYLEISEAQIAELKRAHHNLVNDIPNSYPKGLYKGKGIIMVAYGYYFAPVILSLRILRERGNTLPVEVFQADEDEYDEKVCREVLPSLNAKCVILTDIIAESSISKFDYKGYPLKLLAMLATSFEQFILLDADSFLLTSPSRLLNSEPFISTGMVIFPDLWKTTFHSSYFKIAEIDINNTNNLTDVTSETGEILFNKKTHFKTLLISLYYNLLGRKFYYHLLCQESHGAGDKETFLPAAYVAKEPWYKVQHPLNRIGYHESNEYRLTGLSQYDPAIDYQINVKKNENLVPKIAFIHFNMRKLNIPDYIRYGFTKTFDDDEYGQRSYIRAMGPARDMIDLVGDDFEMTMWRHAMWLVCDMQQEMSNIWQDVNLEQCCLDVKRYYWFLQDTTNDTFHDDYNFKKKQEN